jgi:hypothetical protein
LSDRIGGSDFNDFYRLRLDRASHLRISLRELKADGNLALLDQDGELLSQSGRKGTASETIRRSLTSGVYFVRVYGGNRRTSTQYTLTLAASALKLETNAIGEPVPLEASPTVSPTPTPIPQSFDITFDYRFDTNGWFTPEKKAVLEAAADVWQHMIRSDLPDLPAGSVTRAVINPQTGSLVTDFVNDTPIDDLLIFVGARELGGMFGATLGLSSPAFGAINDSRYSGSKFEPAVGSMAFDTSTDWFFDPTPSTSDDIPPQSYDFFSVVLHEMAHVFGFGISQAFDTQISGLMFAGANATSNNGAHPIPLQFDLGHIEEGYQFAGSGDPLMTPRYSSGTRKLPTVLDLAILNDIGYDVDYSAAQQNKPALTQRVRRSLHAQTKTAHVRAAYGYCGCSSCLMSLSCLHQILRL